MWSRFVSFSAIVGAIVLGSHDTTAQTYTYAFDSGDAAGVNGSITVEYATPTGSNATISADLDFAGVELADITALDSACTSNVTEYKWHIHVKWPDTNATSAALAQCAKDVTGNHYDPLFACGANSEYAGTANCTNKTYSCDAAKYAADSTVCEKGDLSGKFGSLKLDADKKVNGSWVDEHYPLVSENTAQWNIVLHAGCGGAPRLACAVGQFTAAANPSPAATTATTAPTPTPTSASNGNHSSGFVAATLLALLVAFVMH